MEIDDQRTAIRSLIRLMMEATGLDATALARKAGVAPSTLTRFLNKPVKHVLSARTLAKLSQASGVLVPAGGPLIALSERELLAAFRSTDEQGQAMILRLAKSLRRDSEAALESETAGSQPQEPDHPRPIPGRHVKEKHDEGNGGKDARSIRVPG